MLLSTIFSCIILASSDDSKLNFLAGLYESTGKAIVVTLVSVCGSASKGVSFKFLYVRARHCQASCPMHGKVLFIVLTSCTSSTKWHDNTYSHMILKQLPVSLNLL